MGLLNGILFGVEYRYVWGSALAPLIFGLAILR